MTSPNATMALLGRHAPEIRRPAEGDHADDVRLVRTTSELEAAFAELAAGAGGVIELAAGAEPFRLWAADFRTARTDAPVLIRSEDPERPATFERFELIHRENVTVEGVVFEATRAVTGEWGDIALIQRSANVAILDSTFASNAEGPAGLTDGPAAASNALRFKQTTDVLVAGNTFENVHHAFQATNSDDVVFALNELTGLQGDGLRLGGIEGATIQANWMHDFAGATYAHNHSDMIQLWGTGNAQNNADIRIASNLLDSSGGPAYQMIFGRNEERARNGWRFEDLVVEDNVLVGGAWHRISVYDTQAMQIRHNTVIEAGTPYELRADGTERPMGTGWIDAPGGTATIEGNVAAIVRGGADNMVAGAAAQAAHLGAAEAATELRDYLLRPDSDWNGVWGSSLLWNDGTAEATMAIASHEVDAADRSLVHLDAALSRDAGGRLDPERATFTWTFADGTVATGAQVSHDFGDAGIHAYDLTVTQDGGTDRIAREIEIDPATAIDLRVEGGRVVNAATGADLGDAFRTEDGAIVIGPDASPSLIRGTEGAHGLRAFDMAMTVDAAPGAKGAFLYLHEALRADVTEGGALRFALTTEAGTFRAETAGGLFDAPRHVNAVYDGAALTLYVDGAAAVSVAASGTTPPAKHWGLTFGREWGGTLEAKLSHVSVSQEATPPAEVAARWAALPGGEVAPASAPEPVFEPAPEAPPAPEPDPAPLLAMAFDDFRFVSSEGEGEARAFGGPTFEEVDGRRVVDLDRNASIVAEAGLDHAALDGFDVTVSLRYDDAASQQVLSFGGALDVWTWKSSVFARLTTDEGRVTLRAITDAFSDGGFHEIGVGYDAATGRFGLRIDGGRAAVEQASGALRAHEGHDLTLGARGGTALDADVDRVEVLGAADWLDLG